MGKAPLVLFFGQSPARFVFGQSPARFVLGKAPLRKDQVMSIRKSGDGHVDCRKSFTVKTQTHSKTRATKGKNEAATDTIHEDHDVS